MLLPGFLQREGDARMPDHREQLASDSNVTGIRCRVGKAEVALPLEGVGQIIEYPICPLPLARRFIGGLGLYDGRPLLSIALTRLPEKARGQSRITRGILLMAGNDADMDWALEVDQLGAFVRATLVPHSAGADELPPWIRQARDPEGKSFGWIDVPAMLSDLADVASCR
jgi:chemotaxis signal transduction protein